MIRRTVVAAICFRCSTTFVATRFLRRHLRLVIGLSRSICPLHAVSRELAWPRSSRNFRTPMIFRREQCPVLAGRMFVFSLRCQRLGVPLMAIRFFLRRRTRFYTTWAVKAGVHIVHDHGPVVDVMDARHIHVHHCAVVEECAASPLAAPEAYAAVAEAIINAAIKSDVRAPIAAVPTIQAACESPVARSQEHAYRPDHPRPGHPIIAAHV